MIIHRYHDDNISVRGMGFKYDGKVVLRKHSRDSMGNPIGLEERVYHPKRFQQSEFDPGFRESRADRAVREPHVEDTFNSLGEFCRKVISEHDIEKLVFFGGHEDRNLLKRAGVDLTGIITLDLQKEIRSEVGTILSLDKTAIAIGYETEGRRIRSKHFEYFIPEVFKPLLKPHKAVGDAARTFLLGREFGSHRKYVLSMIRKHLKRIEKFREENREIPIF